MTRHTFFVVAAVLLLARVAVAGPREVNFPTLAAKWFSRPAAEPKAEWVERGKSPGAVTIPDGHVLRVEMASARDEHLGVLAASPPKGLVELLVGGSYRVSDAGLVHVAALSELEFLNLSGTRVSDEGLVHVAKLSALGRLGLAETDVSDAGLKQLAGLRALRELYLAGTSMRGEGLAALSALPALERVSLPQSGLGDAGLKELAGIKSLRFLEIGSNGVTDEGLAHLSGHPALETLHLSKTRVTDAGLEHLVGIPRLRFLLLNANRISDAGLVHVGKISTLETLNVGLTAVSNEGLAHLAGLSKLTTLGLELTRVDAKALPHLLKLSGLTRLGLPSSFDSLALRALRIAFPKCEISPSPPTPPTLTVRPSGELVLTVAKAERGQREQPLTARWFVRPTGSEGPLVRRRPWSGAYFTHDDKAPPVGSGWRLVGETPGEVALPARGSEVCVVADRGASDGHLADLAHPTLAPLRSLLVAMELKGGITSRGLAYAPQFTSLRALVVSSRDVDEGALAALGELELEVLGLEFATLTDAGASELATWPKLRSLWLNTCTVKNSGLTCLAASTSLRDLDLGYTHDMTPAGLANLAPLGELRSLALASVGPGDDVVAGLVESHPKLRELELTKARISDEALGKLATLADLEALDLCGTPVGDAGLAHLTGCTKLRVLGLRETRVKDVSALASLAELRVLNLYDSKVQAKGVEGLASFKALTALNLGRCYVFEESVPALSKISSLKHLDVDRSGLGSLARRSLRVALPGCRIVPTPTSALTATPEGDGLRLATADGRPLPSSWEAGVEKDGKTRFTKLKVTDGSVVLPPGLLRVRVSGDEADGHLAELAAIEALRSRIVGFDLTRSKASDDAIEIAAAFSALEELGLSDTRISDDGLAKLSALPALRSLDVSSNRELSGAGMKHLHTLSALRSLSVWGLRGVKRADLDALSAALPACEVKRR